MEQDMKDNQLWDWISLSHDKRTHDKGLVAVWAYRCYRCGYIWLPKDYDVSDKNTLARDPPKSCARCKSKYWNRHPRDLDEGDGGITRGDAEIRESRHNLSPEQQEKVDKAFKSIQRKIRREERKR